jgi:hypothetical protein
VFFDEGRSFGFGHQIMHDARAAAGFIERAPPMYARDLCANQRKSDGAFGSGDTMVFYKSSRSSGIVNPLAFDPDSFSLE